MSPVQATRYAVRKAAKSSIVRLFGEVSSRHPTLGSSPAFRSARSFTSAQRF